MALGCSLRDLGLLVIENRGEETEAFSFMRNKQVTGLCLEGIQTAQNVLTGALLKGPQ